MKYNIPLIALPKILRESKLISQNSEDELNEYVYNNNLKGFMDALSNKNIKINGDNINYDTHTLEDLSFCLDILDQHEKEQCKSIW